jgi:hypothetical protein
MNTLLFEHLPVRELSRQKDDAPDGGDHVRSLAIAIAIVGRWSPGIFWLFAIGELVGYKPCAILAASWWVSGDGQCRDETQ